MKIGIIKEGKIPADKRVPITPDQAKRLITEFPDVKLVVESSNIRCFHDNEYLAAGIPVVTDVTDCDILMGVKEVPINDLLADKTYFFFSHTIKKQPYNQKLIKEMIRKKITMVDYETLTNETGARIVAFGRWAGIVGAYNGIWTFGKRYNLFHLRRANECFDLADLTTEFAKVKLPPVKIAITGGGRVAKGAIEVLMGMNIRKVSPADFITQDFNFPVFCVLNSRDYHSRIHGGEFKKVEFFKSPELYSSDFLKFSRKADILLACAFWDPKSPVLFHREDMFKGDFNISVIADITCDIEGSIPSTKKASTIEDPVYDYNPNDNRIENAFSDEANVTVMAVDNLPCELPRDSSESFGHDLVSKVLPELLTGDKNQVIHRASILKNGQLNEPYLYLTEYAMG